jgi:acetyl-CoA carboxylase biotin carboxyl carrier protein
MDIEEIKTLTALMIENDLMEIQITDGEKRIVLRRGAAPAQTYAVPPVAMSSAGLASGPAPIVIEQKPAPAEAPPAVKEDGRAAIKSPMVGTFYAAAEPDSPPFVQVGDQVNPETVVCIIEAMKVFNEIKAEVAGIIESIEISNGQPVEFGQAIMTVRPV